MSFDLFVFGGSSTKDDQQRWVYNLKKIGIECKFSDDFIFGNYLFSWLYLSVFQNKQETTWKELREIMTY